jgi:protein-tyrosine phosphatase
MDRLKLVLAAGVTQFVDLTDESELPSYESLLPFSAPSGRRIEYQREPIPDHGVPTSDEVMTRILATLSAALDSGQIVYLHCRAGIGRSAMVAGCYLVEQGMSGDEALEALQNCWQQSAKSLDWVCVPETDDQYEYVRGWALRRGQATATAAPRLDKSALYTRARGALLGLAAGELIGAARAGRADGREWGQHTALAVSTAESLLDELDASERATGTTIVRSTLLRRTHTFKS